MTLKTFVVEWRPIGEPDRIVREEVGATDWWNAREMFCGTTHDYHGRRITLEPHDTRIYACPIDLLNPPKPRKDKPHGRRKNDK